MLTLLLAVMVGRAQEYKRPSEWDKQKESALKATTKMKFSGINDFKFKPSDMKVCDKIIGEMNNKTNRSSGYVSDCNIVVAYPVLNLDNYPAVRPNTSEITVTTASTKSFGATHISIIR